MSIGKTDAFEYLKLSFSDDNQTYLTPYFMINSELNSSVVHESLLSSLSDNIGSSSLIASLPVNRYKEHVWLICM